MAVNLTNDVLLHLKFSEMNVFGDLLLLYYYLLQGFCEWDVCVDSVHIRTFGALGILPVEGLAVGRHLNREKRHLARQVQAASS